MYCQQIEYMFVSYSIIYFYISNLCVFVIILYLFILTHDSMQIQMANKRKNCLRSIRVWVTYVFVYLC